MSQAPVREALRDLEILRFVESEPFRGARVRAVSAAGTGRDLPVRPPSSSSLPARRPSELDGEVGELEADLAAMLSGRATEDRHAQVELDVAFHRVDRRRVRQHDPRRGLDVAPRSRRVR